VRETFTILYDRKGASERGKLLGYGEKEKEKSTGWEKERWDSLGKKTCPNQKHEKEAGFCGFEGEAGREVTFRLLASECARKWKQSRQLTECSEQSTNNQLRGESIKDRPRNERFIKGGGVKWGRRRYFCGPQNRL